MEFNHHKITTFGSHPTIPTTRGDGVVRLNIISGRDIIDSIIEITPTVFRRDRNPFESKCSFSLK
ncbi:MAG: hypothetical protein DMENIID0003_04190 [Wolbachia endosymbiont of Sergentomyia squamirostris]|uniref:Uncharacterized protein n=1 Tax=Wolbachia endosymbiont of Sergentomyia squamirostris TaxID=3113640 RepID=A0AAT9GBW5_9RICK